MRDRGPSADSFAQLVQLELPDPEDDKLLSTNTDTSNWLRDPPRELFGLSLSGGGIRSATFSLGLLQGLDSLGLLRCLDYVSTVSGGGYVGGFWTAWRKHHPE